MLPKLDVTLAQDTLPLSGLTIHYRPFTVKEEKILLTASESGALKDILLAFKQIITNCVVEDIDASALPMFDLEVLFTLLRICSVSDIAAVSYRDIEDDKVYDFEIDLKAVIEKCRPDGPSGPVTIALTDKVGVVMSHPTLAMYEAGDLDDSESAEAMYALIIKMIDKVYDANDVYPASECTPEQLTEFVDSFQQSHMQKLYDFVSTMPRLQHTVEWVNTKGTARKIELQGLQDFFPLT